MVSKEQTKSISSGYYVARLPTNNEVIAYDQFEIKRQADGIVIDSIHNILIAEVPQQIARFEMDEDWTPRRLKIEAGPLFSAMVEFGESEIVLDSRSIQGENTTRYPISRFRAYFMMNGAAYFPLHIVRRFDFDNREPQRFDIVPEGECWAVRIGDIVEQGETLAQIEVRFSFLGKSDLMSLLINTRGDLIRYSVRNQNLIVTLEDKAPSC